MGTKKTGLPWLGLTTVALAVPLCTAAAQAGDSGTVFRTVAVKDCAKLGPEAVCLDAPLVSGATTTALEVLRDIYPDLGADGKGGQFAGAEAVDAASDPDAGEAADRAVDITGSDPAGVAVVDAGAAAYAAAVSSGVVAVAQIKPTYKALGRLQVATDPGGPTVGYRLLLAAPDSPVAVTDSSHFNSQEGFDSLHLVGVVSGELVDLYDGPYLYSLAEETEHCQTMDHREDITVLGTQDQTHHGLADIAITVDYAATCINGDDQKSVDKKSFPIRLTFDGTRYDGDSVALDDFNSSFME